MMTDEERAELGKVLAKALEMVGKVPGARPAGVYGEELVIPLLLIQDISARFDGSEIGQFKITTAISAAQYYGIADAFNRYRLTHGYRFKFKTTAGTDDGGVDIEADRDCWKLRAQDAEAELKGIFRELVERGYKAEHNMMRFNVGSALDAARMKTAEVTEVAQAHVDAVREVLRDAGHEAEGAPLHNLVDAAIDRERVKRDEEVGAYTRQYSDSIQQEQRAKAIAEARAEKAEHLADTRLGRIMDLDARLARVFDAAKKERDGADIPY